MGEQELYKEIQRLMKNKKYNEQLGLMRTHRATGQDLDSESIKLKVSQLPVNREIAMTGEVTLRGHVLQIGGLKEKLLAAHRAGIKTVLIPNDNKKDLVEIPEVIKKSINIIPVSTVDEVLKHALTKALKPVKWAEIDQVSAKKDEVTSRH